MQLTDLQKTVWQNLGHEAAATQKIRNTALEYYIEYREHLKQTHSFIESESKIQNLLLISYFISEKSEVVYDINGKKISNIAFSINKLAKKHSDYKDFFYHLKEMMRKITLPAEAQQSEEQINGFMKYFSFVMTFYNKFLSTFDKITICHNIHEKDLQNLGGEKEYKDKIKYLLWVVYISFRKIVFKNNMDTIGNTCLLACLFSYFVSEIYKQERIVSIYSPDIVQDIGTFPIQYAEVQQIWLNFFCLKDIKTYQEIRNVFFKFIQNMGTKYLESTQPFSPKNVLPNIKKLQQVYHKSMDMTHIDQTLFLNNLMSNQENVRFTAFGGKRKVAKYHSNNIVQCRRVLNFDTQIRNNFQDTEDKKVHLQTDQGNVNNYLDVIKKIKASKTPVPLIQDTPINQFSTAYNWLYNKSLITTSGEISLNLQQLLQISYKHDSYQPGNNYVLQKRKFVECIFYDLLNEYDEHEKQSQQNINVASILALEIFYYVMNITNRQITDIVEKLNVSWFSIWEGIDKLLNYDMGMPYNVKTHLLLLQTSIVSSFIWKESSFIHSLESFDISQGYKQFFHRIVHHIAYQINFIGKSINLLDSIMDQAFIVCQYYLKERGFTMMNVNLDVIIMCSIYGVCRAKNLDIKFKTIISGYKSVNDVGEKAFELIQTYESEEGEKFNIILFYNKVYLKNSKSILIKIKEEILQSDKDINSTAYILSPVKSILPVGLLSRGNVQSTPNHSQMLFAYNESPLLRKKKKISLNELVLNKQNLQGTNQRKVLHVQKSVLRQKPTNVNEMIQKKFGSGKTSTLMPKSLHFKQS